MDKHAKYYPGRVSYKTNGFGPQRQYIRQSKGSSCFTVVLDAIVILALIALVIYVVTFVF